MSFLKTKVCYFVLVQNTGVTDNENAFNFCYKGNKVYSLDANRIIIIIIIDMAIQRKEYENLN
jgi:hypothetical protein